MVYIYVLVAAVLLFSAIQALISKSLLVSALWLAATSGLVSLLLYLMGSPGIAVIELSVGAGLVTILFVFVISIIGDEQVPTESIIPKWLAWAMIIIPFGTIGFIWGCRLSSRLIIHHAVILAKTIWVDRELDLYLQAALIVTGVLGILMLIAPSISKNKKDVKK